MSFDNLKKNRAKSLEKLAGQLEKAKKGSGGQGSQQDDGTVWKLQRGADGNGMAVIRFLPSKTDADPWVQIFSHAFQGPTGKWYINNSLTTIGQQDPVSDFNKQEWATGDKDRQEQVRKRKRKLQYVSNILVVKDPANPDNEGKVFKFYYGKKIFDKINDAMFPEFDGDEAMNPFDMWEGADFRLKVRMYEGYPNYDKSEFANTSAISDDEDELRNIYEKIHDLSELLDPSKYDTYENLEKRLNEVLGIGSAAANRAQGAAKAREEEEEDETEYRPSQRNEVAPKAAPAREATSKKEVAAKSAPEADLDDDLAFFSNLANED